MCFYCPSKTVSRILYYVIICLPIRLLSGSSELLLTEFRDVVYPIFCFVLAPNKDLAVFSPALLQKYALKACQTFPPERFCSHLAHYCGRP